MRKLLVSILIGFVLLVACNNNNTPEENGEEINGNNPAGTEDTAPADSTDEEDESDSDGDETNNEVQLLELGETGTLETAIGDFQVTPTKIIFIEEMEEDDPYQSPDNGTFIVISLTLENVGDEPINSGEIVQTVNLQNLEGAGIRPYDEFNSIDNFEGEIAPGEFLEGELLFDFSLEDEYELSFGAAYLESLSNEVLYRIHSDEAN
ncbi:protein of unknown function [Amphibacillus marinus]|uniref:DUF4352 domain-containing protein n=1 Tax=Amphibacillus marinus TaxID=872970 RepID=A0A1H8R3S4_9BACI|nr:DUF4352 domain-containing protein [Amphibacillus marinus]SEO60818.1 protein of unknown function [Amphibacillus marinus]